ncbi:uncharacterized protein Dab isoform X2 [Planococcus citri]|uniref:uncharacterized protein Dab isoform X2 n=1 Tax=Planococcus citri TaxID=170843 RepID=UPI0031FA3E1C
MSNVAANTKDSCLSLNSDGISFKNDAVKNDEESAKSQSKKFDFNPKERSLKGLVNLKQSFRTLSVPKRVTTTEKDKNEPSRFLGDGVTFKAKLIGILEVEEARGDRMCQEALFELKMAVRAAGEHKQRINIVIAIDGIRLRDEKTGDCLYHHPVHKISFIAQDVADSRAFGYIFGSPDTGHRFFGIKTDKAASQVVMAMRDLFQAVYELKKREVEMAKQNIEQHQLKYGSSFFLDSISASSSKSGNDPIGVSRTKGSTVVAREDSAIKSASTIKNKTQTAGVIADLMDLELELNSLQQGLSQMERLTPSDPFGPSPSLPKEDPFGDSFTPPPCITTPPPAKLPPPPASGDRRKVGSTSSAASQPELHWFDKETQDLFSSEKNLPAAAVENADKEPKGDRWAFERKEITAKDLYDVFTELDPLGTGRSGNSSKSMFLEESSSHSGTSTAPASATVTDQQKLYEEHFRKYNSVDSEHRVGSSASAAADDASKDSYFDSRRHHDPFETSFANFAAFDGHHRSVDDAGTTTSSSLHHRRSPQQSYNRTKSPSQTTNDNYHHHVLKSSQSRSSGYKPILSSMSDDSSLNKNQWSKLPPDDASKQKIVINLRKVLSNADDTDKENDSPVAEESSSAAATILRNMDARSSAQGDISSDSFESIPEPPPRPITSPIASQPPPLPPKKLQLPVTMKPPPRPSSDTMSHYDYIENYESLGSSRQKLNGDMRIPPLPAPARKPKFSSGGHDNERDYGSRHRPHKQSSYSSEPEYYLTPITKPSSYRDQRDDEYHHRAGSRAPPKPSSLNITLSQLTSTGFEDLASMLRIPASTLSKMTLKELTECLSRLSDADCQKLENDMCNKTRHQSEPISKSRPNKDDDRIAFKANFDEKFPPKSAGPTVQIDKYAVFRELIEQEEKNQAEQAIVEAQSQPDSRTTPEDGGETPPVEVAAASATVASSDPDTRKQSEDDKYAALRKIPSILPKTGEGSVKESSEKEDSATEHMLQAEDSEPTEPPNVVAFHRKKSLEKEDEITEPKTEPNSPSISVPIDEPLKEPCTPDEHDAKVVSDTEELGKNWAKFDTEVDAKHPKPSPWEEDEAKRGEFTFDRATLKPAEDPKPVRYAAKKQRTPRKRWNDDEDEDDDDGNDEDYGDDSEENWESSKKSLGSSWDDESSWRENGWSDRDSLYDDAEQSPTASSYRERRYQLKKKGYRRKFSPHKKSDEHSPWEDKPDWQQTRKMYKDYVKDDDRIYDERKVRTPPWTMTAERGKRYEEKEEDELKLLKMMLGKKRLKALEEQLFKRYQEQFVVEPTKKSSYYNYVGKNTVKESPCDSEYADGSAGSKPGRYPPKKYHSQRPKSADKGRKPLTLRPDDDDAEEIYIKKYHRRPYSQDELSISEEERWAAHKSPVYSKKPNRSRNQSQTSPFEDNFSPQPYDYTDPAEPTHKKNSRHGSATLKKPDSKRPVELHPYTAYDFKSGRSSRESSQRQSPFEDDFTPPDVQKCSERSSDVSKDSGGDRRNDDEVFFSAGTSDSRSLRNSRSSRMTRYEHSKRMDRPSKHYENVEVRKKTPDSYYDKLPKDKYKYSAKESNGEPSQDLKSPKKATKHPNQRHDPFNDNVVQGYESKTMPRLHKTKSKSKMQYDDSASDSGTEAGVKWKDDLTSFTFAEQHARK